MSKLLPILFAALPAWFAFSAPVHAYDYVIDTKDAHAFIQFFPHNICNRPVIICLRQVRGNLKSPVQVSNSQIKNSDVQSMKIFFIFT